jgi:hypothetical protein
MKAKKQKTCKNKECKSKFTPERDFQACCDYMCAIKYAQQREEQKQKKAKTEVRKELKAFNNSDVKRQTKTAKKVMQEYARLRDISEPCISCRKPTATQWDGGHYMNAENYSQVRFNTFNINKQCSYCNDFGSSNAIEYRKHLILKIGLEKVEELERSKAVVKYTAKYLTRLIKVYRKRNRILKKRIKDRS